MYKLSGRLTRPCEPRDQTENDTISNLATLGVPVWVRIGDISGSILPVRPLYSILKEVFFYSRLRVDNKCVQEQPTRAGFGTSTTFKFQSNSPAQLQRSKLTSKLD